MCSRPAVSTSRTSRLRALPAAIASNTTAAGSAPGAGADEVDSGARRPDLELLDRGGAKRIGRADERRLAAVLDEPGQLADGRGLSRPVHADDHHDMRPMAVGGRHIGRAKNLEDLGLDQIAQRRARGDPAPDRLDDALGRGDADVGGNQRLFQSLDSLDVDRAAPLLRRVRAADGLVELFNELLLRPRERLFDAIEKTHAVIYRPRPSVCVP